MIIKVISIEQELKAAEDYAEGKTIKELSHELSIGLSRVKRILKRHGVTIKNMHREKEPTEEEIMEYESRKAALDEQKMALLQNGKKPKMASSKWTRGVIGLGYSGLKY